MIKKPKKFVPSWDRHLKVDENFSQSFSHMIAVRHTIDVLKNLFAGQKVGIGNRVPIFHSALGDDYVSPDIAVVNNLRIHDREAWEGWYHHVGINGENPRVVIEFTQEKDWQADLEDKPLKYAAMNIPECFAFEPHRPGYWSGKWAEKHRLIGWRLNEQGQYVEIAKRDDGALWSNELESWLVVDHGLLHLYSTDDVLRVDRAEEQEQRARQAERIVAAIERAEQERQAREAVEKELSELRRQMNQSKNGG